MGIAWGCWKWHTCLHTYNALNELGRQMRRFRKSVLLRLHPDKLAGAS